MKNEKNDGSRTPHALDGIVMPGGGMSWKERLERWNKPLGFDDRMSWLHTNYHRDGNEPDHFLFYLDIADRYGEEIGEFTQSPKDEEHIFTLGPYSSRAELKSRLSKKAFAILCTEFFSDQDRGGSQFPFILPYQEPLFSKLLWFFRPYGGHGGWDNLRPRNSKHLGKDGGKHYLPLAEKFAMKFILDAWQILNSRWYYCTDGEKPDPAVAKPHCDTIIKLVLHHRILDTAMFGQYTPRAWVFKKMLRMVFEENTVTFTESDLDNIDVLGKLLEPFVADDNFAAYLYIARLSVYDTKRNETHCSLE
jgi:hypothetical protein